MKNDLAKTVTQKSRIFYLDVVRFLAIILITFHHAVNRGYATYDNQYLEFNTLSVFSSVFETVVYTFSLLGVPLFLMISGALLFKKEIKDPNTIKSFYKHNLLRLFITSEIWFFICYWFLTIRDVIAQPSTILCALKNCVLTMLFINQKLYVSFWYLPMILCLYILVPFLCIVKTSLNWKSIILPVAVVTFMGFIVPSINSVNIYFADGARLMLPARAFLLSYFLIYMIAGYYISCKKLDKIKSIWIIAGFVLSFGLTCAFQYYAFSKEQDCHLTCDFIGPYDFIGVLISSFFFFELIRRGAKYFIKMKKPIEYIAKISFGIYLVHIFIMSVINHFDSLFLGYMSKPIYVLFLQISTFGLSVITIWITSKVPFVKKYLFMM